MSRKLISILTIVSFLVIPSISLAKDFIQIGNAKKEVLEVLGAPTRVSKYEFLNKEVWGYGLSSITFKNGTVYEYTGGKGLKIKLVPSRTIETEIESEFITIGSTCDDVIYMLCSQYDI